jgi:chromatin remodeling complex protein RSC6
MRRESCRFCGAKACSVIIAVAALALIRELRRDRLSESAKADEEISWRRRVRGKRLREKGRRARRPGARRRGRADGRHRERGVHEAGTPDATVAEVVGDKPIPRTEVTKRLWAYIKKNGLQDNKNKADDQRRSPS